MIWYAALAWAVMCLCNTSQAAAIAPGFVPLGQVPLAYDQAAFSCSADVCLLVTVTATNLTAAFYSANFSAPRLAYNYTLYNAMPALYLKGAGGRFVLAYADKDQISAVTLTDTAVVAQLSASASVYMGDYARVGVETDGNGTWVVLVGLHQQFMFVSVDDGLTWANKTAIESSNVYYAPPLGRWGRAVSSGNQTALESSSDLIDWNTTLVAPVGVRGTPQLGYDGRNWMLFHDGGIIVFDEGLMEYWVLDRNLTDSIFFFESDYEGFSLWTVWGIDGIELLVSNSSFLGYYESIGVNGTTNDARSSSFNNSWYLVVTYSDHLEISYTHIVPGSSLSPTPPPAPSPPPLVAPSLSPSMQPTQLSPTQSPSPSSDITPSPAPSQSPSPSLSPSPLPRPPMIAICGNYISSLSLSFQNISCDQNITVYTSPAHLIGYTQLIGQFNFISSISLEGSTFSLSGSITTGSLTSSGSRIEMGNSKIRVSDHLELSDSTISLAVGGSIITNTISLVSTHIEVSISQFELSEILQKGSYIATIFNFTSRGGDFSFDVRLANSTECVAVQAKVTEKAINLFFVMSCSPVDDKTYLIVGVAIGGSVLLIILIAIPILYQQRKALLQDLRQKARKNSAI